MPDIATLLVFAAAALALVAVPWPNIPLHHHAHPQRGGRRNGLACSLGVKTGTLGARLRQRTALRCVSGAVSLTLGATAPLTGQPRRL